MNYTHQQKILTMLEYMVETIGEMERNIRWIEIQVDSLHSRCREPHRENRGDKIDEFHRVSEIKKHRQRGVLD